MKNPQRIPEEPIFDYVSGGRGGIFAVSGQTTAGGNFAPVAVSGFNADIVVEANPPWPPDGLRNYTTASMDGGVNNTGNTWHEQGYFPNAPWSGLPAPGTIITSLAKSDHHYQLPATYTGPNAAFVDSVRSNVNLTLAQPKAYSALSFLSATANNSVTNQAIIQFADGTSETNTFVSRDWFNNTPYAFTAAGRVSVNNRTVNNIGTTNPRLYEAEFALANNVSPVTNINLRFLGAVNPTTGRMVVLAVSATAGAVRPIIATQPNSVLSIEGANAAFTSIMGGGTPPIGYQWYADTGAGYAEVQNSALISGATSTSLSFSSLGWTNAGSYYMVATNIAGPSTSSIVTLTVRSGLPDVSKPGDEVMILGGTTPAGEPAENAINNTTTKYLNRDTDAAAPFDGPQGFTLKPAVGPTIVNVLRFYTANDDDTRDPASYVFEGSNDEGGTWTEIGSGPLAFPTARNAAGLLLDPVAQAVLEVRLNNTADYKLYKLSFNSVRGNTTTGLLQIGEVEFLGSIASIAGPPVVRTDLPARALVYAGRALTLKTLFGGSDTLTYAWTKGGQPVINGGRISGADTDTLVITDVQPSDAASYQVTATNGQGSAPSTACAVTVETRPDFNGDGLGWVLNGGASITDNVLRITDAANDQARSAWFANPLYVGSFRTTFTYRDVTTAGADGFTVALQNSPLGTAALGGAGGALAINGVSPSAEIMFNIYNSSGIALGTNGTRIGDFSSTAPVDIRAGNPIDVEITYASGVLNVHLTDTVSNTVFTASYQVDIPAFAGGSTAYVGITGATGGANAEQTISNFVYTPLPTISTARSGGQITFSWPATIGGYKLQSRGELTSGTWTDVPAATVVSGGMNTVTVTPAGTQFYILTLQ